MKFLSIILCWMHMHTFAQDFQVRLTHSAINKLVQYAIPLITEHVESQRIPSQTVEGVLDVEIGTIAVRSFTFNLTFDFHPDTQQIEAQITDLSLLFFPFRFTAGKQATDNLGLTCHTVITPSFSNWNFAFKLDTFVDDQCTINLVVDESSIVVDAGTVDINAQFVSTFCESMVATAAFIFDLEKNLQQGIVEKMPDIITNDMQTALDDAFAKMRYIEEIEVGLCYTLITITEVRFAIGGDIVTNVDDFIDWKVENTTVGDEPALHYDTEIDEFSEVEVVSASGQNQNLLVILFVVFVIVAIGIGIGLSYAICACVYRKQFKAIEEKEEAGGNKNEQEPMMHDTSVVA